MQTESSRKRSGSMAWSLALGGFLPFMFLSVTILLFRSNHEMFGLLLDLFKIWSAMILSFLGGIRWGIAIGKEPADTQDMFLSVLPCIIAWFAVMMSDVLAIMTLTLLYSFHGAWDSFLVRRHRIPEWFGKLRVILTILVVSAHLLVVFAIR